MDGSRLRVEISRGRRDNGFGMGGGGFRGGMGMNMGMRGGSRGGEILIDIAGERVDSEDSACVVDAC